MATLAFVIFTKLFLVSLTMVASCSAVQMPGEVKANKVISRGRSSLGTRYASFKAASFSYLNITYLGRDVVDYASECGFACLKAPSCFSYNLAAFPYNGKLFCELLPSDSYNNSGKLVPSKDHHHFSIASPCSSWPCKNNGMCVSLYDEDNYVCVCKEGITGKNCKTNCREPLGMENGDIKNQQISASSEWSNNHAASQGRLNFQAGGEKRGAWSSRTNDTNQWLQIDLRSQHTIVTGVATQGRNDRSQWVTRYKLQYGDDGVNFTGDGDKELAGNTDQNTVVYHDLNPPIRACFIRFRPVDWHLHISMRVELYGYQEPPESGPP